MSHIINVDAIVPALSLQQCVRISSNQWLTDEVTMNTYTVYISICTTMKHSKQIIQVYMELIRAEATKVCACLYTALFQYTCSRYSLQAGVKMHIIFSSQFMEKFENSGYRGVSRWYRKVRINKQLLCIVTWLVTKSSGEHA